MHEEGERFETGLILAILTEKHSYERIGMLKEPQASKEAKKMAWQQSSHAWEKPALTFLSESPVINQVTTCYCSSRAC